MEDAAEVIRLSELLRDMNLDYEKTNLRWGPFKGTVESPQGTVAVLHLPLPEAVQVVSRFVDGGL